MAITRDAIVETLKGALERASNGRADVSDLNDNLRLIEDIGLSSLDLLDLRFDLEQQWHLKLDDKDLASLTTVGDAVHVIQLRAIPS